MKQVIFPLLTLFTCTLSGEAQTIFSQNFDASTSLATYISSSSPTTAQWNAISTSGAGVTLSTAANNLTFNRSGANSGSFSRTTDFSPTPAAMIYEFDLSVSGNTAAQTTAAVWQVGSGFGTANSAEANADVYGRFGLNFTATDGSFQVRDISSGTNSSSFSGVQSIFWVLNNSDNAINYTTPTLVTSTVANDTADLWIGTNLAFDNVAVVTPEQTMTDLKFAFTLGSGSITMDNFTITAIPEPSTAAVVLLGLTGGAFSRRRRLVTL